jgi:hypothetical protein
LGTPLLAKLSLATFFVPKYNLGTSGKKGANMALTNAYVQVYGQLSDFFQKISEGQAPSQFTRQLLKDLGFKSSNHHAMIPLLKALGFLTSDGSPTSRYHEYRSKAQSRRVMAEALREAYADLFIIKEKPTEADRALIEGKFKSVHNVTDRLAKLFFLFFRYLTSRMQGPLSLK